MQSDTGLITGSRIVFDSLFGPRATPVSQHLTIISRSKGAPLQADTATGSLHKQERLFQQAKRCLSSFH